MAEVDPWYSELRMIKLKFELKRIGEKLVFDEEIQSEYRDLFAKLDGLYQKYGTDQKFVNEAQELHDQLEKRLAANFWQRSLDMLKMEFQSNRIIETQPITQDIKSKCRDLFARLEKLYQIHGRDQKFVDDAQGLHDELQKRLC